MIHQTDKDLTADNLKNKKFSWKNELHFQDEAQTIMFSSSKREAETS